MLLSCTLQLKEAIAFRHQTISSFEAIKDTTKQSWSQTCTLPQFYSYYLLFKSISPMLVLWRRGGSHSPLSYLKGTLFVHQEYGSAQLGNNHYDKLLLRTQDSASKSSCPPGVWTCSTGKRSHIPDRQFPAIAVTVFETIMKLMVAETQPTHHYVSRRVETTKCSRGWSRKEHLQSRPSKPQKLLAIQAFGHVRLENDKGGEQLPS